MIEGIDARIVSVVPVDPDGIGADFFDGLHAQLGLEHLERIGGGRGGPGFHGIVERFGSVPWAPVHEAQGHSSRRNSLENALLCPSDQSMVTPRDLETAMWSGFEEAGVLCIYLVEALIQTSSQTGKACAGTPLPTVAAPTRNGAANRQGVVALAVFGFEVTFDGAASRQHTHALTVAAPYRVVSDLETTLR